MAFQTQMSQSPHPGLVNHRAVLSLVEVHQMEEQPPVIPQEPPQGWNENWDGTQLLERLCRTPGPQNLCWVSAFYVK